MATILDRRIEAASEAMHVHAVARDPLGVGKLWPEWKDVPDGHKRILRETVRVGLLAADKVR